MSKKSRIIMWVVIALLVVAVIAVVIATSLDRGTSIDSSDFIRYTTNYGAAQKNDSGEVVNNNGQVTLQFDDDGDGTYDRTTTVSAGEVITRVEINGYQLTGRAANGSVYTTYYASLYSSNSVISTWDESGLDYNFSNPNSGSYWSSIITVGGLILLCVVFWLIIRSTAGGAGRTMSFAKSKARISTNIKVRFTDVAGAEEEKLELAEVVEFLKQPKKFSDLGARIPKGVLLVGPPGTGKTLFAKAVAGEAGVPFFSVSGSDFVEMYVGVGASRVRDLFDMAKKNQPCIIFVDEIDAVGRHRGAGLGGGNDEREQTLNQLLVQMDGFATNEGIIVMAATNRADILDPALMRPGRFDRQIYVNPPDVRGREAIFRVHARNKPLASDVDFKVLARITAGFTGADIANVLNEAAILCARDNRTKINMEDIDEAINKVAMGPAKKSRLVTEYDKRITAYHESGHAIVRQLLPTGQSVHLVTIVPRGNAGGFTFYKPDNDSGFVSKKQYEADIASAMGGRAAEQLVIGDITQGAMGDIQQATNIARNMVTRFGMSDLGPVCYESSQEVFIGRDYQHTLNYSDDTASKIDAAVAQIIDKGYDTAYKLLEENKDKLDVMVRVLMECETIYAEEVELIMQGKSVEEVIEAANKHAEQKLADKSIV